MSSVRSGSLPEVAVHPALDELADCLVAQQLIQGLFVRHGQWVALVKLPYSFSNRSALPWQIFSRSRSLIGALSIK